MKLSWINQLLLQSTPVQTFLCEINFLQTFSSILVNVDFKSIRISYFD